MSDEHTHGDHGGHEGIGHVASMKVLVGTFVALLVLTVLTVAVAYVDWGSVNLLVAMGVATVKAAAVVLYFMHLRYDKPFHAVVFVGTLLFVVLFITLTLLDTKQYQPEIDWRSAPALEDR